MTERRSVVVSRVVFNEYTEQARRKGYASLQEYLDAESPFDVVIEPPPKGTVPRRTGTIINGRFVEEL